MRKLVTGAMLLLLAVSMLALAIGIRPARADGTIYINADGSITPQTAPISTFDNITYTFTGNVDQSIVVQRNNTVIDGAGYAVEGLHAGTGIYLESISNVTVENASITGFYTGIWFVSSSDSTLSGNNVTGNYEGIVLDSSSDNTLRANNAAGNPARGIALSSSSNNTLEGNNVTGNSGLGGAGIHLQSSSNNTLSDNVATENYYGIVLSSSSGNVLFQNAIGNSVWSNFGVYGSTLSDYVNSIDASNLADGKPVYYIVNQEGLLINPATNPNIGYIALVNCTNITIENLTLANKNKEALLLAYTTNSTITETNLVNNDWGIYVYSSSNNTLSDNIVTNSTKYTATGIVIDSSSNNIVCNNSITGNGGGIHLNYDFNNTVSGNNVTGNPGAIGLLSSTNDTVIGNIVAGSTSWGIWLLNSSGNTVSGNTVTRNNYGGIIIYSSFNDIVSGNNVNGNFGNGIDVSYHSFNETVCGNDVAGNSWYGILFFSSYNSTTYENETESSLNAIGLESWSNSTVSGNNVTANGDGGIVLVRTCGNVVWSNNAVGNRYGILIDNSANNTIYHNNFINNTQQAAISYSRSNFWDNNYPSGGNYWSYAGVDEKSGPSQDQNGSDGIDDAPYVIDANNTDLYPLMAPITSFNAGTWNGTFCKVEVESNSTVFNMQIDIANKTVSFNLSGPESTHGFFRVTIPNIIVQDLWHGNYTVLLDSEQWPSANWTDTLNTYIYVDYAHLEHEVVIIPEFPFTSMVWLATALSAVATALAKRRKPNSPRVLQ